MNNKSTKTEIKEYIYKSNLKLFEIIDKLSNYGISTTPNAFTNKLNRDTIRYSEVKALANILGYQLIWQPINKVDERILSELKRSKKDINVFEGFMSNILGLTNTLKEDKGLNFAMLSLMLNNKEITNILSDIFQHLGDNYKELNNPMDLSEYEDKTFPEKD